MIVSLLLLIASLFYALTAAILPNWSLPDPLISALDSVTLGFTLFNTVIPLTTIASCAFIILIFHFSIIGLRMVFGGLSLVRGGGKLDL